MPCSPNSTPCARCGRSTCANPETQSLRSLDAIVRAYCHDYRKSATREYAYGANHSSFNLVIQTAALSTLPCGKRHPHQRRIPANALQCAAYALTKQGVATSGTFHDLHQAVHATIGNINPHWRIGCLRHRLSDWRVSWPLARPGLPSRWHPAGRTSPCPPRQLHPQARPTSSVSGIEPRRDRGLPLHLQEPGLRCFDNRN